MEREYLEKKIKSELINKEFKEWCKESIEFLVSIFQFESCHSFFTVNLLLLKNYISWLKKNNNFEDNEIYDLETLNSLYKTIKKNIEKNKYISYDPLLNKESLLEEDEENYCYDCNLNNTYSNNCCFNKEEKEENEQENEQEPEQENETYHETNKKENDYSICDTIYSLFDVNNCFNTSIIIIILIYAVIKYITCYLFYEKRKEQKKEIFEFKIPIPENIASNPFIKDILQGITQGSGVNFPFQF
jgi:hypothetical protein